uniref:HTH CENPB-type domain-containing protein n=1 Tax=Musca domestica TaxID=7370 RepID=A0A1I8NCX2_MUSDO
MNEVLRPFCSCRKCVDLNVKQRIAIIQEYESSRSKKPSIKSLASKFDCCFSEIKKILLNRASILAAYKTLGGNQRSQIQRRDLADTRALERREKINFLGKAMYEYIQRVLYANYNIDDEKVMQKAWEFKHQIDVDSFEPDQRWLLNFKRIYGIWSFEMGALRKCIRLNGPKEPHLSAINIVEYVRRRMKLSRSNGGSGGGAATSSRNTTYDIVEEHILPDSEIRVPNNNQNQYYPTHNDSLDLLEPIDRSFSEPTIVYENAEDDEPVSNGTQCNITTEDNFEASIPQTALCNTKRTSKLASIESVEEALEHLKLLEEFAMLQDNFRAIGLLTQLEQCFSKQPKTT